MLIKNTHSLDVLIIKIKTDKPIDKEEEVMEVIIIMVEAMVIILLIQIEETFFA
jgi:hypothetical protein